MDEILKIVVAAQDEASGAIKKIASSLADLKTTAILAGAALGALTLKKSIDAFTDFQSAMKQSIAIMGDVSREMEDKLMRKALEVSNSMAVSQEEVARAYYYLASAGLSAKESLEAVTEVAKLAVAAHMDMADATDIAVNTMKAFGLTVQDLSRINDTLIATVTKSNTNLQQLGEAMKYVAPFAHQVGWSVEEVSAALGLLANHGVKASQAGTYLRQAIAQLIDPTDSAKEAIENLGLKVEDLNPETHSLAEILQKLSDAGATTADIMKIFGVRAGSAIAILMQEGAPALRQFTEELKKSGGITDEVRKKQEEAFGEQWKIFQNNLRTLAITIGSVVVPALNSLLQPLIKLIQAFNNLLAPVQKATGAVIALGSAAMMAAGAIKIISGVMSLLGMSGTLSSIAGAVSGLAGAFGGLAGITGALSGALSAIGTALAAVAGAISLSVVAIAALSAAIVALVFNIGGARDKLFAFAGWLKDKVGPAVSAAKDKLLDFASTVRDKLVEALTPVAELIEKYYIKPWFDAFEKIKEGLEAFKTVVGEKIRALAGSVKEHLTSGLAKVGGIINEKLVTPAKNGVGKVRTHFEQLKTSAQQGVTGLRTALAQIKPALETGMITAFTQAFARIGTLWDTFKAEITSKVQAITTQIKTGFTSGLTAIKTIMTTYLITPIRTGVTTAQELFRNMVSGIRSTLSTVRSAITDPLQNAMNSVINSIKTAVTNAKNAAFSIGRAIVDGIRQGLSNIWNVIRNALLNPIQSAIDEVKNLLGIHSPSRVFMAIGQNVVKGYAEGLKRTFKEVPKTLPTPQPGTPAIPTLTPAPAVGGVGAPREVHIYVDLHGAVIKEEADVDMIVDKIERRLAAYL